MSTTETPRYRIRNRPTTTAAGGIVRPGEIIETHQPPNQFFEPVNVEGFRRCVAAGFDPLAYGGPEAKEIAAALKEAG